MNITSPRPDDPRMARLKETIEESRSAIAEFRDAMRFVNDSALQVAAMPVVEAAELVFSQHWMHPSPTIANDTANLLAAFNQLNLPNKDVDFGPLLSLRGLRGARGNIREEFNQVLFAASALGWRPIDPVLPEIGTTEVSRDGLEGMLKALIARMEAVEHILDHAVKPEGEQAPDRTTIQIALVNIFVRNLQAELTLAKLEARVKNIVDLSALGRAIENVTELTADFVATVQGIAAKMTTTLREASEQLRPRVRDVTGGFKIIIRRIASIYARKTYENSLASPDLPVGSLTRPSEPRLAFDFDDTEVESNVARLEKAVTGYRAALRETARARHSREWAAIQNNLGSALFRLGNHMNDVTRLEDAVEAYRAALQEYTREAEPASWGSVQNNLGRALRALGEREGSIARLEEAVEACRAALQEYTRNRVPLQWAGIQNNLGNALLVLGERKKGTIHLEEAIKAYRAALLERTQLRVPHLHGRTERNLKLAVQLLERRRTHNAT